MTFWEIQFLMSFRYLQSQNIFVRSSSERFKDRARVYVVNGDGDDDDDDHEGEDEDSSAADDLLKFSEKHEFEVSRSSLIRFETLMS